MTENKRYNIKPSKIIEDGFCIQDDEKEHSFPTVDDKSHLIMYEKALNEQDNRIKELEQFINKLSTDGSGRIWLANGYGYKVSAILTDYNGDSDD